MQKINQTTKVRVNNSYYHMNRNSNTFKSVDKLTLRPSNVSKNLKQLPVIQKPDPVVQKTNAMKVQFRFTIPKQPFTFNEESGFGEGLCDWLEQLIQYSSLVCQKRAFSEHLSQEQIRNQFCKLILGHIKELGQLLKDVKIQNKYSILVFMDKSIKEIMKQYLPKYMPIQLNQVNWVEQLNLELIDLRSDEFDFLLNNNLTVLYQKCQNYTPFIMTVINKIVDIETQFTTNFNSTYSESFRTVCERISSAIQEKKVSKFQHMKRPSLTQMNENTHKKQLIRVSKRSLKIQQNDQNISPVQKGVINNVEKNKIKSIRMNNSSSLQSSKVKIMQINRNSNPFFQTKFSYQLNKFTDQQILMGDLTCHSSTLIKILLKWVEQLEQILYNSQETIKRKMSKFKTHNGKLITLFSYEKKILLKYILQQKNAMVNELQNFKMEYKVLQAKFLQQKSFGKFLKIEANLGAFCSKTQEAITQYLLRYLNKLIHILLLATVRASNAPNQFYPDHITPDQRNQSRQKMKSLNLVTFKIKDLFVSKFKCTQTTFPMFIEEIISLTHQHIFKIVKVQDERNQPEGNLILNIFFENKILSQFHLYIHKNDQIRQNLKNSLYNAMNKIVKADFGAIFKLCLIISQCDPMIKNYCQYKDQSFLKRKETKSTTKVQLAEMRAFLHKNNIKASLDKPFICDECQQLKIVLNPKLYDRVADWDHLVCNDCKQYAIRKSNEQSKKYFELTVKKNANITKEVQIKYDYLKLISTKEIDIKNIPKFGFYISLSSKTPVAKPFKMITYDNPTDPCLITLNHLDKPQTLIQIDKNESWIHQFDKILLYEVDTTIFGWSDETGYIQYLQSLLKKMDKIQKQTVQFSLKLKKFLQCLKQKQRLIYMNGSVGLGNEIAKYLGQIQADCSLGVQIYMSQACDESKQIKYQRRRRQFGRLAAEIKSLQLEDCAITQINNFFNEFLELKELNLTNNKISLLQNFQDMTQLETIILDRNKISNFHFLSKLPYIKSISLNSNEIKGVPLDSTFNHLQQLYLKNNKITSMAGIQKMQNLIELDLSDNQISIIQNLNQVASSLKILKIRKNGIVQMKGIQELLLLEELYLSGNHITQISHLNSLVKLNILDLSDNQIIAIDCLEKLIQMKQLYLTNNKIKTIQNIQTLKKLKKLKLNKNSIQIFQNLNGLIMLSDLDLSQNNMTQVINIQEMNISQITNINLSKNKLQQCPDLSCLKQLVKINFNSNKIKKISGLNGLVHLQQLDISYNQIIVIENMSTLINLNSLNLSHNDVDEITGLQNLEKLQILNLSCCQLKQIKNCEKLEQIETLLLNNNQIKSLKGIQNLKSLKNLNVANNAIPDCADLKFNKKLEVLFINYNYIKQLNIPLSLSELCLVKASDNIIQKVPDLSLFEKLKKVYLERNQIKELNVNELLAMKSLECINVEENHFMDNIVYYRQILGSKLLIN